MPRELQLVLSRLGFFLNLPELRQILRFRAHRRAFWARYWAAAAGEIKARFRPLGEGLFRLDRDGRTCFVRDGEVGLDSHLMLDLMGDKALCNTLLRELGQRVIPHAVFALDQIDIAETFWSGSSGNVVVKPASGTGGGRGVTTGVDTLKALRKAARYAARYDDRLIVEREVKGRSYRLLFLGGAFVDAILRDPPLVIGDGVHRIDHLVRAQNADRLRAGQYAALSPILMNADFANTLRRQGLSRASVPAQGQTVVIKGAVNENDRRGNHNVRNKVHIDTIALCANVVSAIGVEFAGIDILCEDIARPLSEQEGYITEINTTPGLHHHVLIDSDAERVPVAIVLLEAMLADGRGAMRLAPIVGARRGEAKSRRASSAPPRPEIFA